jgi:hypothetical protein
MVDRYLANIASSQLKDQADRMAARHTPADIAARQSSIARAC